jgi:hypothetical protein
VRRCAWKARVAALSLLFAAARAQADDVPEEPADRAERLFREGRAELKEEHYALACEKLAESAKLEAATGTLLNWAVCLEKLGQRIAAWSTYRNALELARTTANKDAERLARQQLVTLEGELVRLTVVPPLETPAGFVVKLDATELPPDQWQRPLALEPGDHVLEATSQRRLPWSRRLLALEAGTERVVVVPLPSLVAEPPQRWPEAPAPQPQPPQHARGSSASWLLPGAVALVGLATTTYFGARAAGAWHTRQAHCGAHGCDETAVSASETASHFAHLADLSAAVTVTAAITSVWLAVSVRHDAAQGPKTPHAGFDMAVRAEGTF